MTTGLFPTAFDGDTPPHPLRKKFASMPGSEMGL